MNKLESHLSKIIKDFGEQPRQLEIESEKTEIEKERCYIETMKKGYKDKFNRPSEEQLIKRRLRE